MLKRYLDENASFVSAEKLNDWVQRLNDISDTYASTEWEIVLTNRFAKLGTVEHERQERAWIDLVFNSNDSSINFAADIVTVSDYARHKSNPVEALWEELRRRVRYVATGGFALRIGEKRQHSHPGSGNKRQLLLPTVADFGRLIFNDDFRKFLQAIKLAPASGSHYHATSPGVDVLITYIPGQFGVFQGAYGSYTDTTVVDDNPLFNALEKKARGKQLKRCNFSGPKGLLVCDGGCRMLDEPLSHNQTYSVEQVVRQFFRKHKSVDFISTIAIKSDFPPWGGPSYRYVNRVFVAPGRKLAEERLRGVLAEVVRSLPILQMTPENAVRRSKFTKSTGRYLPHRGGWEISGMKARISARSLLELMAGRLDQKQFAKDHEIGGANFFEHKLKGGELITSACVEQRPDEDDDWITFEFGPPDVATAAFESPASKTDKTKC
ncbi:MAG: hypothetical protein WCF22_12240 [Candidatus Sulfotelmatobacter sp.]